MRPMDPVRRPFRATRRNLQVLLARCATGSRKDAAAALGISIHTVHSHLNRLQVGTGLYDDGQLCFAFADDLRAQTS